MLDVINEPSALDGRARLERATSLFDLSALLLAKVPPGWDVAQEIDPVGEISIVVMPGSDAPAKPSFLLFERDGRTQVATIRDDSWESDRAFASRSGAVAAVIAAVTSYP